MEKRNKIIGIGCAAVALVLVVVGLIFLNYQEPIPDDYFKSDGTKLVMSLSPEVSSYINNEEYEPLVTHVVYYYNGDKVNNAKIYFQYDNEEDAKEADKNLDLSGKTWATGRKVNGKYIVFTVDREQYKDLTVERVERNIKNMRDVGGLVDIYASEDDDTNSNNEQ